MQFILDGPFKPYVRMTQRSKWTNPQAQEYLSSKAGLGLQLKAQMRDNGWKMLPAKTALDVDLHIIHDGGYHNKDLDNQIKALLDAAQGIVFRDDRWVDSIAASREQGHQDRVYMIVTVSS